MKMKKIVALILALMLALSAAGCSTGDTSWVAKSGDTVITPGMYITYLMMGINDAAAKASDPEDPLSGEIDGIPAKEYVINYAKREITKYLGGAEKFRALGLSLSEDDIAQYQDYADYIYELGGEYYEMAGVSKDSVLAINENSMKAALVFDAVYGEGGELEMTEEEYDQAFADTYYRAYYYVFPKVDFTTGSPLSEEEIDQARADAEDFYAKVKAGGNFVDLMYEYRVSHLEEGEEVPERYEDEQYEYLFYKDDTNVPPAFLNGLSAAADGDVFKIEDEYYYYVVCKLPISELAEDTKELYRLSLLQETKYDEFVVELEKWGNELEVEYNDAALKAYTPEKVKKDADAYAASAGSSQAVSSSSASSSAAESSSSQTSGSSQVADNGSESSSQATGDSSSAQ